MAFGQPMMRCLARLGLLLLTIALGGCEAPGMTSGAHGPATALSSQGQVTPRKPLRVLLSSPSPPFPEIDDAAFSALRRFYAARDQEALWVGPEGLTAAGEALRARLERVHVAGHTAIAPLTSAVGSRIGGETDGDASELELLLSTALLRTAVNPDEPASARDWPEALEAAGSAEDRLAFVQKVLPVDPAFWRLRSALPAYRSIEVSGEVSGETAGEAAGGWPAISPGPKLEPGASGPRVVALKDRLSATGDLSESGWRTPFFDGELDAAVRRFQARHGLLVDGVVGEKTLAALNVPVERRRAAIELNLRRLFAQRREWGERYIAVNAAAATYRLVEPGRTTLERAAIVGRPSWPTPPLDGLIDRLEFNPYWTVPPRITRLELLPKIERDPDYLRRNDMRWVAGQLRQDPGPKNPLGQVKFLFDNPYSVYLHDTNNRRLFERPERFLSHGCVRVAAALDLARRLLAGDPRWPARRIDEVLLSGHNRRADLPEPIAVHIVYDTAWVDDAGIVHFRNDIYGRDRRFEAARGATPSPQVSEPSCPSGDTAF